MKMKSDPEPEVRLTDYDDIFKKVGDEKKIDWRLLCAICHHESEYKDSIVSPRGAIGLMQIMPENALRYGVDRTHLFDPYTNISVAAAILRDCFKSIRRPRSASKRDRIAFTIAAYNCGIGHVLDARRLASRAGKHAGRWDEAKWFLIALADSVTIQTQDVKCGKFSGGRTTLAHVRQVLNTYDEYCLLAPEQ